MSRTKKLTGKNSLRLQVRLFLCLALALTLVSLLAPWLTPNDPYATNALSLNKAPSSQFPMGTDRFGRCVFSRVLMGARTSIFSASFLVVTVFVIGTVLGLLAGWYGGILDSLLMRLADILMSVPQMVLAIAVAGILGGSMFPALLSLGISQWTSYARLTRSQVMKIREEPYIQAARMSGCSGVQIMFRHMLPNVLGPLVVNATTEIGTTMIHIAGLSFLGIGIQSPQAEWGSMIDEMRAYIQLAPWAVLAPAGAMLLTVMIFNYLGDSVRDLMDVSDYE